MTTDPTYPTILITGSKGRIGRVMTVAFAEETAVYGLDIAPPAESDRHYVQADIRDFAALDAAFGQLPPIGCVIHLAGNPSPVAPWDDVLHTNIIGTRNVYECCRLHGVRRVLFASSIHASGAHEAYLSHWDALPERQLVTVYDPVHPISDYGTSKAFGEVLARQYYEQHGLESICIRICGFEVPDESRSPEARLRMWFSQRDAVQFFKKAVVAPVRFGIYYGVSDNHGRHVDISNATADLGYVPQDDAFRTLKR